MGPVAGQIDQPVILDNTVLTNLALVGRADLVTHLWPATACTTPSVLDEYRSGAVGGWVPADAWAHLTVVTMTEEETALTARFSTSLCRSYCPESTRRSSPPVERTMVSTVQSNGRSLSRPLTPGGF